MLPPSLPPQFDLDCFGPPRVFRGEDAGDYHELLGRICAALEPRDVLEQIWVRDVADLVWEICRLRRMKTEFMNEAAGDGVNIVLEKRSGLPGGGKSASNTAERWAGGDREARNAVDKALAAAGLTMDAVGARTLVYHIWNFERIDRMTQMAEERRDSALHEIERYRAGFGRRLRQAVRDAEQAESAVLAPTAIEASP
jgi:hypothetical protein